MKMKPSPLSLMPLKIKDDAIFIADAHYQSDIRESLYHFLLKIERQEIVTSQLIMMGDMFDLLVGTITYTKKQNQKIINLITKLSNTIEIIYLEGNHDFNLRKLFPSILVVPITSQPLHAIYHDKKIILSHGDLYQALGYRLYTKLIRNKITLNILNIIDKIFNNYISKDILLKQKNKEICKKIKNFAQIIKQKSKNYDIANNRFDVICEGHYHMDEVYSLEDCSYRLFASFACSAIYFRIEFKEDIVFIPYKG